MFIITRKLFFLTQNMHFFQIYLFLHPLQNQAFRILLFTYRSLWISFIFLNLSQVVCNCFDSLRPRPELEGADRKLFLGWQRGGMKTMRGGNTKANTCIVFLRICGLTNTFMLMNMWMKHLHYHKLIIIIKIKNEKISVSRAPRQDTMCISKTSNDYKCLWACIFTT